MPEETPSGQLAPGQASLAPGHAGPGRGSGLAGGARVNEVTRDGLTYERARAELEDVVRRLEAGGTSLEEALALWERGEDLARMCQELLDGARARLQARHTQQNPAG